MHSLNSSEMENGKRVSQSMAQKEKTVRRRRGKRTEGGKRRRRRRRRTRRRKTRRGISRQEGNN